MAPEHTYWEEPEEAHHGHHGHEKEEHAHGEHGHHGHGHGEHGHGEHEGHEEHGEHGHGEHGHAAKKEPDPVPLGKMQIVGAFCGTVTTASHYMNVSIPLDYEISIGHILPLLASFKEAAEATADEAEAMKGHKLIEDHHEDHHGEHHDEHHGEHHGEHHEEHHGEHHEEHHGEHHEEEEEEEEHKEDLLKAETWQDLWTIFAGDAVDLAKVAQEEQQSNVARKRPYKAKLEALKVDYEKKGVLLQEVQRQNADLREEVEKLRDRINHEIGNEFKANLLGHEVVPESEVVGMSESGLLTAAAAIQHAAAHKTADGLRESLHKHDEHEHEKENIPANIPTNGHGLTIPPAGALYSAGPDVSVKGAFMGQVTSSEHCFHVSMPIEGVLPAQLLLEAIRSLKASNPLKPVEEEEHGHEGHGHEHGEEHEEGHEHGEKHGHEHGHEEKHGEEHGHHGGHGEKHGEEHGHHGGHGEKHGEEHGHHGDKHGEEHGHHGEHGGEHGHHGEHGGEHGHHGEEHGEEHGEKLIAPEVFDQLEAIFAAECLVSGLPHRPPPVAPSHETKPHFLSNMIKNAEEAAHEGSVHGHADPHGHADRNLEHMHQENGSPLKTQYFNMDDDKEHAGKRIEEAQAQVMDMTNQVKYLAEVNRESAHRVAMSQKQVRELKDEVERMLPMRGNMRVPPLRSLSETREVASNIPHREPLDDWYSGHPKAASGRTSPHPLPGAYGGAYVGSTVSSSSPPSSKISVHSPSSARKPLNKHVEELQKLAAEMRGWGSAN